MKIISILTQLAIGLSLAVVTSACESNTAENRDQNVVTDDTAPVHSAAYSGDPMSMEGWSEASRLAYHAMMKKYGKPDEMTASMAVWYDTDQWTKTKVLAKEFQHDFPVPHTDVLEQTINYKVPLDKYDDLAMYDGAVTASRGRGELSARCDMEAMNFLAINLSNDICKGTKDVNAARDFYAKTAGAFMLGDRQPYTMKLQFDPMKGSTIDSDVSAPMSADMKAKVMKAKEEMVAKMKADMKDMK